MPTPTHQSQPGCRRSKGPARIAVRRWLSAASPPTATRSAAACSRKRTTPCHCASTRACAHSKGAPRAQWSARPIIQATTNRGTHSTPGGTMLQPIFVACASKTRRAPYLSTPAAGDGRAESVWDVAVNVPVLVFVRVSSRVWRFSSSRGSQHLLCGVRQPARLQ